jgi:hypothetical protein
MEWGDYGVITDHLLLRRDTGLDTRDLLTELRRSRFSLFGGLFTADGPLREAPGSFRVSLGLLEIDPSCGELRTQLLKVRGSRS